ncbi:two-component system, OmpR family, response regulator BaeR [Pseudomonas flavescens]|uniref:Two-component system, OmpR family, response regulator BaeR n=1 Tax=Phytopseudomonas flavescens TaxID=29435 RepID=A0A1G7Z1R0_9GAMM|nr:response regulator [Pseudomonas flavescens]SDH02643.1 two-component system, OmpR family, response regulator BaeR [Pseudomonas flavescens]
MMAAPPGGRILIVEDEPRLSAVLRDYLQAAGYSCQQVFDGADAVPAFRQRQPDLVILDLMLPNRDGIDICRELRTLSDVPVIMVTARVEEIDRLLGLELGADDYVCKPFSPREVVARVHSVLRRHRHVPGAVESARGLSIDNAACRACLHGHDLGLTLVEFRLLRTLAAQPGRVYSRDHLMNQLYDDHRIITDRTIDSHVKNLRRKLGDVGEEWIRSVYGVGYRFET